MVKTARRPAGTIKRTYGPGWVLEERLAASKSRSRGWQRQGGQAPHHHHQDSFCPSSTEVLVLIGDAKDG